MRSGNLNFFPPHEAGLGGLRRPTGVSLDVGGVKEEAAPICGAAVPWRCQPSLITDALPVVDREVGLQIRYFLGVADRCCGNLQAVFLTSWIEND
jgi:hypothetical protein